ncbi:MAG: Fe2+-dependent dioxygenase [Hyphomicrobiales bacterium]
MFLRIADALTETQVDSIVERLSVPGLFEDGASTAGWHARAVKHNEQARTDTLTEALAAEVTAALLAHPVFASAARPKKFVRVLFSRYRPGMAYGTHVDDALMDGERTDLSFTLFLSDPATYEGGALIVEEPFGDRRIRLNRGELILYPSGSLHRVEPVARGERLAVVGWVRSVVRDAEAREMLFDLDQAVAAARTPDGASRVLDLLLKTRANLLRRWAE